MARPFRATERAPDLRARRCPWDALGAAARCFAGRTAPPPAPPPAPAWVAPAPDPEAWYAALRRARRDGVPPVVPADADDGALGAAFVAAVAVCLDADAPPPPIHFASALGCMRFAAMVHALDASRPQIRRTGNLGAVADAVARWGAAHRGRERSATAPAVRETVRAARAVPSDRGA